MTCTWTFSLSRFFNTQISCATAARKATDLSEMWLFSLCFCISRSYSISGEETVKSKKEREERKAQDFSLWSAINNPFAVNTRILQPRSWPHHGDNLSGSIYNIFCIADKKCQRDLAGKFAAMLSVSLVCCSGNLETYKSAFRDQAFNSSLVLLWYHYI